MTALRRTDPWRRRQHGLSLLVALGGLISVAAVADTVDRGLVAGWTALAFAGFIAIGEFVRFTLPGEREAAPLAVAGALAYALLPRVPGSLGDHTAAQVVTVALVGMLFGALPHAAVGRSPQPEYLARRVLSIAFAAAIFRPWPGHDSLADQALGPGLALSMIAVALATGVFDAGIAAVAKAYGEGSPLRAAMRDELQALLGIGSAIAATGMLIALAAAVMGLWALPVFSIPLLLTQFSFRRYAGIRATYLQTIRALSRVTELGGYTETGHSRRVSELAVAVGREMGMDEADLLDLEYAALMHDIGQLSLADPIPGGATIVVDAAEQQRIAWLGGEVIRQTGVLDRVAEIVQRQAEPYRWRGRPADPPLPLASRIIKAVNALDDLVGDSSESQRLLDALEQLRLDTASEYDPRVVRALSDVVERLIRGN